MMIKDFKLDSYVYFPKEKFVGQVKATWGNSLFVRQVVDENGLLVDTAGKWHDCDNVVTVEDVHQIAAFYGPSKHEPAMRISQIVLSGVALWAFVIGTGLLFFLYVPPLYYVPVLSWGMAIAFGMVMFAAAALIVSGRK